MNNYDLIVLGAGNGGIAAASLTKEAGWKVLIVEGRDVGGTCALRGCVPKKVMVAAAEHETDVTFCLEYQPKWGFIGWLMHTLVLKGMFTKVFSSALDGLSYHLETGELVGDSVPTRRGDKSMALGKV